MSKVTPKILTGFMELTPNEQLVFDKIKSIIASTYESFGFVKLDTPVLELSQVLLAKAGGETEKQIYRFNKGDTDLCMRFDLTVPLARYVAQRQNDITFPFRRYQIAKVYRGERPQKGRFREFYQADIDIIGSEKLSVLYDAEVPAIMYNVLRKLGLNRFHIYMNNRKVLKGFYKYLGLEEQSADILRIIDKADKIGMDNVKLCLEEMTLPADKIEKILSFSAIEGDKASVLEKLNALNIAEPDFQEGLTELQTVATAMEKAGIQETHYKIDLKITRGLDYYTGTVYETFLDDYRSWGSICSGGRYDNLAEFYTDRKLPGIGMSIGLTRFFDLLRDAGMLNFDAQTPAQVLVIPMDTDTTGYALEIAETLRKADLKVMTYLNDAKFKNKMVYANKINVPYVLILGTDEMQNQVVTVKDMLSGTQESISADAIAEHLKEAFAKQAEQAQFVIKQ